MTFYVKSADINYGCLRTPVQNMCAKYVHYHVACSAKAMVGLQVPPAWLGAILIALLQYTAIYGLNFSDRVRLPIPCRGPGSLVNIPTDGPYRFSPLHLGGVQLCGPG